MTQVSPPLDSGAAMSAQLGTPWSHESSCLVAELSTCATACKTRRLQRKRKVDRALVLGMHGKGVGRAQEAACSRHRSMCS